MIWEVLLWINYLLSGSLILFLLFPLLLQLITLFIPARHEKSSRTHFYSCIITAYEDAEMCHYLIDSLMKNNYEHLEIILILDNLNAPFTPEHEGVQVIRPSRPLHSKLKSIRLGMEQLSDHSEGVIILDPDNLVHPEFLSTLNQYFISPYVAVQGRRKAKNQRSAIARADALGEAYNNHTDRALPFRAGSSSTLAGSGMVIARSAMEVFLKNFLPESEDRVILGEDKLLQNFLVQQGYRIAYAEHAVIYDEKTERSDQLRRQRARWILAYFENVRHAAGTFFGGLAALDWNQSIFGMLTMRPPRFLTLFLLVLLTALNALAATVLTPFLLTGLCLFFTYFLYQVIRLNRSSDLLYLPPFWFHQLNALLSSPKYRKDFGKTRHGAYLTIDDVLKNDTSA